MSERVFALIRTENTSVTTGYSWRYTYSLGTIDEYIVSRVLLLHTGCVSVHLKATVGSIMRLAGYPDYIEVTCMDDIYRFASDTNIIRLEWLRFQHMQTEQGYITVVIDFLSGELVVSTNEQLLVKQFVEQLYQSCINMQHKATLLGLPLYNRKRRH